MNTRSLQDKLRSGHTTSLPRLHRGHTQLTPHTHLTQATHSSQPMHSTPLDTQSGQSSLLDIQERNSSQDIQETFSDTDYMQVEMRSGYPQEYFSRIGSILQTTKGKRSIQVKDYFSDLQLFQESAKYFYSTSPLLLTRNCPASQNCYLRCGLVLTAPTRPEMLPLCVFSGVDMKPHHGTHQVGHSEH